LGMKQLHDDPWATTIPTKYQPGQIVTGTVTKLTNFGVFVSLENDVEGLLHISELADHKVENPEEVVKVGETIEVKILRVDPEDRKIGLSRKRLDWAEEDHEEGGGDEGGNGAPRGGPSAPATPPSELRGGVGGDSGPLIKPAEPR
jgi:small subunit ribosomal protein S1